MLNIESTFQIEAGSPDKHGKHELRDFVQVYKIKAERLLQIIDYYPAFRRFMLLRATQRRSHFLKVFEELRQNQELNIKRKDSDMSPMSLFEENQNLNDEYV